MTNTISPYLQRPVRSLEEAKAEAGRVAESEQRVQPATDQQRPTSSAPPAPK